jgi:hypothetical protein
MKKIVLYSLSVMLLIGCNGGKRLAKDIDPNSIPSDLRNEPHVLLVQKQEDGMANHQNRLAERMMKKHYKGRYEMVFEKDMKTDSKYADVNVYRYVLTRNPKGFSVSTRESTFGPSNAPDQVHAVQYRDEIIYDRKENKVFPSTGLSSHNFAQGVMYFAKVASVK